MLFNQLNNFHYVRGAAVAISSQNHANFYSNTEIESTQVLFFGCYIQLSSNANKMFSDIFDKKN